MRKSILALALFVVLITGSIASAQSNELVLGARYDAGKFHPYVYFETLLRNRITFGAEYWNGNVALALWFGVDRGFYAEARWTNGLSTSPDAGEIGVWQQVDLSDQLELYGWFGVKRTLKAPVTTSVTLNGEAHWRLNNLYHLIVGGRVDSSHGASDLSAWVGVEYNF